MSILSVKITAKLSGVDFAVKTAVISRLGAEHGRLRRPRGAAAKSGAPRGTAVARETAESAARSGAASVSRRRDIIKTAAML